MTRVAWSPDDEAGLRVTVLGELRRTLGSLTDEIRPVGPGWVARSRSLPLVWSLNQLRITEPTTFAAASALADEYLAGLPYRHIVVEDEPTAARLEGSFRAAGWTVDREVLMALAEPPDRVVDTGSVVAFERRTDAGPHEALVGGGASRHLCRRPRPGRGVQQTRGEIVE